MLDEVIICRRRVQRTLFEINCHGGIVPLMRVVAALRSLGFEDAQGSSDAAPACGDSVASEADAVRCEAAEALPKAMTPVAAKMLLDQGAGALSTALEDIASALRAKSDAAARESIAALLRTAELGIRLCAPPRIVIAGRPNVGKSTLFNRLLKEERTLVDPAPGTTRDSVDHGVSIKHYPFVLIDTAGIAAQSDELGRLSGQKSRQELRRGHIVLLLIDRSRPFSEEDREMIDSAPAAQTVPVLTKSDLPAVLDETEVSKRCVRKPLVISAQSGAGMDQLEQAVIDAAFPVRWRRGLPVVFTARQQSLLSNAVSSLDAAAASPKQRQALCADALARIDECLFGASQGNRRRNP
jgi:tRNA modification GTPase